MKHLKKFETETAFEAAKPNLDEPWVTLTEDNEKAHFMPLPSIVASWVGGGEADATLDKTEVYSSPSPMKTAKKLTAIKFPSTATNLLSLDSSNLDTVDLSEVEVGSPIIEQVKETVGDDVEVIEPIVPQNPLTRWYQGNMLIKEENVIGDLTSSKQSDVKDICTKCDIGTNVTNISVNAFFEFENLIKVSIPNSVAIISQGGFWKCSQLTAISIPNSITAIGNEPFWLCSKLTNIIYDGTIDEWRSISKSNYWKNGVPSTCIIHCSDGDISIADA